MELLSEMSAISELMRESPAYKKVVLAAAVTAGVGACVYLGYRCASTRGKGPDPRSSKPGKKSDSLQEKPSVEKEEPKKKAKEIESVKIDPLSKLETVRPTSSSQRADELSTSGTFEKISLAPNESDNFEHLTMSQVHPTEASPSQGATEEKCEQDVSTSTISFLQAANEGSTSMSIINPPEMFESLSASQAEQSISFITSTTAEEEAFSKPSVIDKETESNDDEDNELLTVASTMKLKDENDIVVVEPSSEDSSFEKTEERTARSGIAATDVDFDPSRVSPVFGRQTYQRVNIEAGEMEVFDPAKSHPASIGFKFDANI